MSASKGEKHMFKTLIRIATTVTLLVFAAAAPVLADSQTSLRIYVGFQAGKAAGVERSLQQAGAATHYRFDALRAFVATVPVQALKGLRENPNVSYIEEDPKRFLLAQSAPYGIAMVQADDPALQPVSASRTVCIIDSGYNLGHEDLPTANVSGTNDPGTGNWYTDENSHGTHVAGTIAALDNTAGVVGVFGNSNINLHIIKVFGADGWAYSSTLVDAGMRCEEAGANVISMSLGGSFASSTEETYFAAADSRGVLSIAAAGNDGNTRHSYPASYDAVISVAAIDENRLVADFSQQTSQVELSAPGVLVRSTVPMGTGSEALVTVDSNGFAGIGMEGSPTGSATGVLVDCGIGTSSCPGGGGQVCLVERGDITFAEKVQACEAGGGVAAVIYNNAPGGLSGTLGTTVTGIPSLGVSDTDGAALRNHAGESATVVVDAGNYAYFDGTSMATPHVSGVAALVWSNHAGCTSGEIRAALDATAEDLGAAGRDNAYGYGLVQASAANSYLAANGCGGGDPDPEGIQLVASGYKVKGAHRADLAWTGAASTDVDVYRNGAVVETTANDGAYTDNIGAKGKGSYTFQVCEAGTATCSATSVVMF